MNEKEQLCPDVPDGELRDQLYYCRDDWARVCKALNPSGGHMDTDEVIAAIAAMQQVPQGAVSFAVQLADGSIGELGWQDMRTHDWYLKSAMLRDGARYVYAHCAAQPTPGNAKKKAQTMVERTELQRAEFKAADVFATAMRGVLQTSVVDDDYPQVRHHYDNAKRALIEAFRNNGALDELS